ncbi:hypothetical protein TNCV_3842081 [Trichonephila clavipes]|nr:hypothetical protein TNCV_3842081 [Trichonephila clavipes]
MGKLPNLDALNLGQIVGAPRMGHSIFQNRQTVRNFKVKSMPRYMDGGLKTSDRANCKGQLALTVRGERRLRRIVRSQRN